MRLQLWLNLRRLVLALIALLSFGAILLNQSDGYLRASAAVQTVASVNAASYEAGPLARGSLASVFGNNLAAENLKSEDVPPPTKLGGVTFEMIDSANVKRAAGLVMVSPQQINFVIPDEMALNDATFVIKDGSKPVAEGKLKIVDAKPALFTSGSTDNKLAVGMTNADSSSPQSLVDQDGRARMIGAGPPWAPTTLTLLATGLRYAESVQIMIGEQLMQPTFVGPDTALAGVDRVDVKMPMNLRGGMNKLSLVVNTRSSATATSGATTQAAAASESSSTTATSNQVQFNAQGVATPGPGILGATDVQVIIAQAVAKAQQMGVAATIALRLGSTNLVTGKPTTLFLNGSPDPDGLEGVTVPLANGLGLLSDGAALAAISKAGTAAFFSTQGSAISRRTASFIIPQNFPPTVTSQAGGPLFGVQFSQLPCSDVRNPTARMLGNLPFGLAGDPGGHPIYKNGVAVGGVGVEFDGLY